MEHAVEQLAGARVNERLGQVDLGVLGDGVEHGLAELFLSLVAVGSEHLRREIFAQLGDCFEPSRLVRELVG